MAGDDGLADASTPSGGTANIAVADGQPIVLFPGAVAPPEQVYAAGPVITNPNTDPNDYFLTQSHPIRLTRTTTPIWLNQTLVPMSTDWR